MNEPARSALLPREEQIEKAVGRKQMSIGLPVMFMMMKNEYH